MTETCADVASTPSGVNLAGILGGRKGGSRSLGGSKECDVGRGTPPTEEGSWKRASPPVFHLKWCVLDKNYRSKCTKIRHFE